MLTKGIIKSIDYLDNTCKIQIPLFETAGTREPILATSIMTALPGVYGGYKVDDVVIIGFETEDYGAPIILGKLFLGNIEESKKEGGAVRCSNLIVDNTAVLPASTKISYKKPNNAIKNTEATLITYDSVQDIANAVALNSKRINDLGINNDNIYSETEQIIGSWLDGSLLYQKTFHYTKGTTRILLNDINFNIIWIDPGQSFYVDCVNDVKQVGNTLLTSIDLEDRAINIPALTSEDGYGYVTIKYTKK